MYSQRISTAARYNLLASDIKKTEANFNRLTAQLASGKKISSITDDPIGAVNIVNTNRQISQIETFNENVGLGKSELETMDDLLDLAGSYLSTAWNKAVQANNEAYSKDSLKAIKIEVDEIAKTIVDLANTEYNDNYIFGGANTKRLPYEMLEDGSIKYVGTKHDNPDYIRQTEVADGVFEVINTTGDKVFGWYTAQVTDDNGNNIFLDKEGKEVIETIDAVTGDKSYAYTDSTPYTGDTADLKAKEDYSGVMGALRILSNGIQELIDAHESGDTEGEQAGYEKMFSTLNMFSESLTQMTNEQTKFGGVYNRLEMSESTLETNNENLTEYLSQLQDVDLASAISKWYQAQYAYQASLQVASQSMNMSLLNYI